MQPLFRNVSRAGKCQAQVQAKADCIERKNVALPSQWHGILCSSKVHNVSLESSSYNSNRYYIYCVIMSVVRFILEYFCNDLQVN